MHILMYLRLALNLLHTPVNTSDECARLQRKRKHSPAREWRRQSRVLFFVNGFQINASLARQQRKTVPRTSLVGRPVEGFGRPDCEFEIFTIREPLVKIFVHLFPAAPTPRRWPIEPSGIIFHLKHELTEGGGNDCRERSREMV
jgi:hypothetical protein